MTGNTITLRCFTEPEADARIADLHRVAVFGTKSKDEDGWNVSFMNLPEARRVLALDRVARAGGERPKFCIDCGKHAAAPNRNQCPACASGHPCDTRCGKEARIGSDLCDDCGVSMEVSR